MSRYEFPIGEDRICTVGWDPPLGTYFAQVHQKEPRQLLLWVGADLGAITSLDDLCDELRPYTAMPDDVARNLLADKDGVGFQPNVGTRVLMEIQQRRKKPCS